MSNINDVVNSTVSQSIANLLHEGRMFELKETIALGAGATYNAWLEVGSSPLLIGGFQLDYDQDSEVIFYEGGDWNRGTGSTLPISRLNRNRKDVQLTVTDGEINPTTISKGTEFSRAPFTAVAGSGNNKTLPAVTSGGVNFILDTNEVYLVEVTNTSVTPSTVTITFTSGTL